jgi:hypothetical protein
MNRYMIVEYDLPKACVPEMIGVLVPYLKWKGKEFPTSRVLVEQYRANRERVIQERPRIRALGRTAIIPLWINKMTVGEAVESLELTDFAESDIDIEEIDYYIDEDEEI